MHWCGLPGAAAALALARAAQRHRRVLVLVAATAQAADRYLRALRFFLGAAADEGETCPLLGFPAWGTLPYDHFSPAADVVSERLATLARLPTLRCGLVVTDAIAAQHRLVPPGYLRSHGLWLRRGERLARESLRERLLACGYRMVNQVHEHGELALRGSLIDLFPMGAEHPYRIDLLDEEIDSIRCFDTESQRSTRQLQAVELLPASETPLDEAHLERFRSAWREHFSGNPRAAQIYRELSEGRPGDGMQNYLPLFFDSTASLFDYLPPPAVLVTEQATAAAAAAFRAEAQERFEQVGETAPAPLPAPVQLFLDEAEWQAGMAAAPRLELGEPAATDVPRHDFAAAAPPCVPLLVQTEAPLQGLLDFLTGYDGRVLLAPSAEGDAENLAALLQQARTPCVRLDDWHAFLHDGPPLGVCVADLEQGLQLPRTGLTVLADPQLFGARAGVPRARRRRRRSVEDVVRSLSELAEGDAVVHEDYGVGRYRGLTLLEAGGVQGEFLCLEYAGGDKLYVPVTALAKVGRYLGGDPRHAPLHRLGSGQWEKVRRRAARSVRDVAAELLELHARRLVRPGRAFTLEPEPYRAFCRGFPFEETTGQTEAIEAVLEDLCAPEPMDRLVCGDSGFGKTEVAMRAAFIAVQNGRQVALLAPTTLLAEQHCGNFRDRFAAWPVRIARLSRFCSPAERKQTLAGIADGSVDIVIGTHSLLQRQVRFLRLGLVVLDEEHRFGVRQKERLKQLRAEVDILSLTATPIPRTLSMAFTDLRGLSVISTPPAERLPVRTFVSEWNPALLHEALLRELRRGGQIYFVHNRIRSIEETAAKIKTLLPEVDLRIAHGRTPEAELERIMNDFYHRRFQLLLCTDIIENGINVPSANTIVIDRADRLGLAQLYQLRGRVGRSHHAAYAYLLTPPRETLGEEAMRRLQALEALDTLGVGFSLAVHDLEIRGAGELLGEEQSGHIEGVGYGLYTEWLRLAVEELKSGHLPDAAGHPAPEIELGLPALLPEDYVPDAHVRLVLYKRIAATPADELDALRGELSDRFGPLPVPAENLLRLHALRHRAAGLALQRVQLGPRGGLLQFHPDADAERILQLVQRHPQRYRLAPGDRLRLRAELPTAAARMQALDELCTALHTRNAA